MTNRIYLGVCGFGYSGSGAILDLLKEYSNVYVADKAELSILYTPDGLEDLHRAISTCPSRYWSSDSSIRRFLKFVSRKRRGLNHLTNNTFDSIVNQYLEKIIQIEWNGHTGVHIYQDDTFNYLLKQQLARRIREWFESKFFPINVPIWPQKKMYFSYLPENVFVEETKSFVSQLLNAMIEENSANIIAVDQLFAANNPIKSFCFLDNPRAIIVQRDPRDVFLLAKNAIGMYASFIPSDDVHKFVCYYRGLMQSSNLDDERILVVQFEDLIYNYEETTKYISSFLNLSKENRSGERRFRPEVSLNNTQLWLKYPQYEKDITIIEDQLGDYIFDFNKYSLKPNFHGKTF